MSSVIQYWIIVYVIHVAKGSLPWKVRLNVPMAMIMHVYNITQLSTCSSVEYYYYSLGPVLSVLYMSCFRSNLGLDPEDLLRPYIT